MIRESQKPKTTAPTNIPVPDFLLDEESEGSPYPYWTNSVLEAESEIDRLIILDREVDLITPCLSQLTYEGLIDEVLGIANG